jgi:hypothetical protein
MADAARGRKGLHRRFVREEWFRADARSRETAYSTSTTRGGSSYAYAHAALCPFRGKITTPNQ